MFWTGCGNSYDVPAMLHPGRCWHFVVPRYTGPFVTMLRVSLLWRDDYVSNRRHAKPVKYLYSVPFRGSIHTGQFVAEQ